MKAERVPKMRRGEEERVLHENVVRTAHAHTRKVDPFSPASPSPREKMMTVAAAAPDEEGEPILRGWSKMRRRSLLLLPIHEERTDRGPICRAIDGGAMCLTRCRMLWSTAATDTQRRRKKKKELIDMQHIPLLRGKSVGRREDLGRCVGQAAKRCLSIFFLSGV